MKVDPKPIFVRDVDLWTSAGVTAGIDLSLALVEDDLGPGPAREIARSLAIVADRSIEEVVAPDVVVVPGGFGTRLLLAHEPLLSWLRRVHEATAWTTSVCTGALLLAAAGLLDDAPATTHWLARETLASLGARPVTDRVVRRGKIISAAGVCAGIDMALRLVQLIYGDEAAQAVQLGIEYDPDPPFNTGSLDTAPLAIVEASHRRVQRT